MSDLKIETRARSGGVIHDKVDAVIDFLESAQKRPLRIAWFISQHRQVGDILPIIGRHLRGKGLGFSRQGDSIMEIQGGITIEFVIPALDERYRHEARPDGWITSRFLGDNNSFYEGHPNVQQIDWLPPDATLRQ